MAMGEVLKCDPRSMRSKRRQFRPVQHNYCHLDKECNLNQSKDDSFVGRVAKNNT